MTYAQLKTKSGAVYQINVVDKKARRIGPDGKASEWSEYKGMIGGAVGESLTLSLKDGTTTQTTEVVQLSFPKSKEAK